MTAPATIESPRTLANRLNAQKSTGPRTEAGKSKSALNALKHGLTAQSPLVPGEDPAEFQSFSSALLEELNPQTIHQFTLAQQLILTAWKLSRVTQIEAKILAELTNRHPLMVKWRQDCADIERGNNYRRRQLPLPEKPTLPASTTDDLAAQSFFPAQPGQVPTEPLNRFRKYHNQLLTTYLRLQKAYESTQKPQPEPLEPAPTENEPNLEKEPTAEIQNEPNSPEPNPIAQTENEPKSQTEPTPEIQNEPNPLPQASTCSPQSPPLLNSQSPSTSPPHPESQSNPTIISQTSP